jgi:hypothetical protein
MAATSRPGANGSPLPVIIPATPANPVSLPITACTNTRQSSKRAMPSRREGRGRLEVVITGWFAKGDSVRIPRSC